MKETCWGTEGIRRKNHLEGTRRPLPFELMVKEGAWDVLG